jgi:hypothetical protein
MFFKRTYQYNLAVPKTEFRTRLVGTHVTIHNLDFEIYEQDDRLCIVPHAEQVTDIKTLPITWIDFKNEGGEKVVIESKIRQLDAGGPNLIMVFCVFLLIAAIILSFTSGGDYKITLTFLAIDAIIYGAFWMRMKRGYLDYVHKIRDYVKARTV